VNGVASESLGPLIEGVSAIVVGISIAFYFCWQMAVLVLGLAPLLAISSGIGAKL